MCENCRQRETQARDELKTLASGELPTGMEYEDCETDEDREDFRMKLVIVRAAMLISNHVDQPMSIILGSLAGVALEIEMDRFMQREIAEAELRHSAQWN